MRAGRMRSEVSSAVWPWTSWKLGDVSDYRSRATNRRLRTYNKLQNSSMPLLTALAKSIIIQILVKLVLRHSELGISAVRLCFTWQSIHQTNTSTEAALMTSSAIFDGRPMLWISDESILWWSAFVSQKSRVAKTYANTYDSVAIPVLRTIVPTQSISKASRLNIVPAGLDRRSSGSTQKQKKNDTAVVAPAR